MELVEETNTNEKIWKYQTTENLSPPKVPSVKMVLGGVIFQRLKKTKTMCSLSQHKCI